MIFQNVWPSCWAMFGILLSLLRCLFCRCSTHPRSCWRFWPCDISSQRSEGKSESCDSPTGIDFFGWHSTVGVRDWKSARCARGELHHPLLLTPHTAISLQLVNHSLQCDALDGEFHGVSNAVLDGIRRQLQKPFRQKFREAKPIASTRAPG